MAAKRNRRLNAVEASQLIFGDEDSSEHDYDYSDPEDPEFELPPRKKKSCESSESDAESSESESDETLGDIQPTMESPVVHSNCRPSEDETRSEALSRSNSPQPCSSNSMTTDQPNSPQPCSSNSMTTDQPNSPQPCSSNSMTTDQPNSPQPCSSNSMTTDQPNSPQPCSSNSMTTDQPNSPQPCSSNSMTTDQPNSPQPCSSNSMTTDQPNSPQPCSSNSMTTDQPNSPQPCSSNSMTTDQPNDSNNRSSRKRKRNPEAWKSNQRKAMRQAGLPYVDRKGKDVAEKSVNTLKNCRDACRFQCALKISDDERKNINKSFWGLPDEQKSHFYALNTRSVEKSRKRTQSTESRRNNTIEYFFHLDNSCIRVCKIFFLSTLNISERRIHYFHKYIFDKEMCVPRPLQRGHTPSNVVAETKKDVVRQHIKSFPAVESHYCRQDTGKQYLDSALNISKMYRMYTAFCVEKGLEPVKASMYSDIFNKEFNFSFHKPKKDQCDKCYFVESRKERGEEVSEEKLAEYELHAREKVYCREERTGDRERNSAVLCFDLQNVIPLPKAEISSFFYRRKLSCYNLTGHCSIDKQGYGVIWNEGISGRAGNDIASALYLMLTRLVERHPMLCDIILWSDSCVPQNRNSVMAMAIKCFLFYHPHVNSIIQKFSTPGHSCIQEVDSIHSVIERHFRHLEIFSPVALLRNLTRVQRLSVIQMKPENFIDFQKCSQQFVFSNVPFSKVRQIKYLQNEVFRISYKLQHCDPFTSVSVRSATTRKQSACDLSQYFRMSCTASSSGKCLISKEKVKDIQSMMNHMPAVDKEYMSRVCRL